MRQRVKYRKSTVGPWVLFGKLPARGLKCYICDMPMYGEVLHYTNINTGQNIIVGSGCVKEFEARGGGRNPANEKWYPQYEPKRAVENEKTAKRTASRETYNVSKVVGVKGAAFKAVNINGQWKIFHNEAVEQWLKKNPTLVIPVKSRKQLSHLFKAQSQLQKAGVTFDTGTNMVKPERHWELDWSLRGAKMRNPAEESFRVKIRDHGKSGTMKLEKFGGKWYESLTSGDIYGAGGKTYMGYLTKSDILNWLQGDYENVSVVGSKRRRNPSTQAIGNALGGLGVLSIPLLIGLIIWANNRMKK